MGDAGGLHDQMAVFLEGTQVDTVNTAAGQYVTKTYPIAVNDGQLTLKIVDLEARMPTSSSMRWRWSWPARIVWGLKWLMRFRPSWSCFGRPNHFAIQRTDRCQ